MPQTYQGNSPLNSQVKSTTKGARNFGRQGILPGPPMGLKCAAVQGSVTDAGRFTRSGHQIPRGASQLQFVYHNSTVVDDIDYSPIKIKASFEITTGTYIPIHFEGEDPTTGYVTVAPGCWAVSKPLGYNMPGLTKIYVNTNVQPAISGGTYPIGYAVDNGQGENWLVTTTDYTATPSPGSSGGSNGFVPIAICAVPTGGNSNVPVVLLVGDSIAAGVGGFNNDAAGTDGGLCANAFQAAGICYMNYGSNGYNLRQMSAHQRSRQHKMEIATSCTSVFLIGGTNDLNSNATLADMKASLTTLWADYAATGAKVWAFTVPPRTTSTDSFATVANQSAATPDFGPEVTGGSVLTQLNAWIRAKQPNVFGVVDLFSYVAKYNVVNNTWVWDPTKNLGDGTHPLATAVQSIIPVVGLG